MKTAEQRQHSKRLKLLAQQNIDLYFSNLTLSTYILLTCFTFEVFQFELCLCRQVLALNLTNVVIVPCAHSV